MTIQPTQAVDRRQERLRELLERDAEVFAVVPLRSVQAAAEQARDSLAQLLDVLFRGYADRPALGRRAFDLRRDDNTGRVAKHYRDSFDTISYEQLRGQIEGLSSAWRHHERAGVAEGDFVCMLGFTGPDYVVADYACIYGRQVAVPLQTTMARADLGAIVAETAATALVASVANLELAVALAGGSETVRSIVVIDYTPADTDDHDAYAAAERDLAATGSSAMLIPLTELVEFGRDRTWTPVEPRECDPARVGSLIYTSGSTGTPKGAIYSEGLMRDSWSTYTGLPTINLGYTPMSHTHARKGLARTLARGGTMYFTLESDMSTFLDDIRLVRPTTLALVPRVADSIYQHYRSEVLQRSAGATADDEAAGHFDVSDDIRAEVMAEMRSSYLGDRLLSATLSTAPTPPEVKEFLRTCFEITVDETYGMTETGGTVCIQDHIHRASVIDYFLRDVPELGYYATDLPYPRGELLVKTRTAISGYFHQPEATAALFDSDGYIATGDVVEERAPDHVIWVDRKSAALKLSQGEYVTIGALEARFESELALVRQIYLYGNSRRPYLLAVIVPDTAVAEHSLGHAADPAELRALLHEALQDAKPRLGLASYEVPRDFILELEPFTAERGQLSGVGKLLRQSLKRDYGERLEALYAELEDRQLRELSALTQSSEKSTLEKVGQAFSVTVGVADLDLSTSRTFAELGGDSLSAVELSVILEGIFGIPVPVSTITGPGTTPQRLATLIDESVAASGSGLATFDSVHSRGETTVYSADLTLDRFFDPGLVDVAHTAPLRREVRTVLITGANGYLGRFLCLEWLERVAERGGRVVCIVRAADLDQARQRLDDALTGTDPRLTEEFRSLAADHLELIVGDITEPWLGLPVEQYGRLTEEVDLVLHSAALVNHMLGYRHLFGPNVAGTAELIKFALSVTRKRFGYVSSVAVSRIGGGDTLADEDADARTVTSVELTNSYINGYITSKWAGEVLLRDAHEKFGLPVDVYRSDMILAHREYAGQLNVPDTFTRLLYSIVMTGLAPDSFYVGDSQRAHYDGLPVDFTAAVMARMGDSAESEFRTVNFVNATDDGLSLDTFVDWIAAAGYPVHRIAGYENWLERFEAKLRALPEDQRAYSSLAIIDSLRRQRSAVAELPSSSVFAATLPTLGDGLQLPSLDEAFIGKCLADLRALGLIPPPR